MGAVDFLWVFVAIFAVLAMLANGVESFMQRKVKVGLLYFAAAFGIASTTGLTLFWITMS